MSLNGDMLVMRNGRSTSQISIYNYPEHKNPFYEDDNLKRLRFWKISKQNGNDGRRNSFSISNLKDMWAFKSFKLKKKSSTLGVNKTSESPPPLRHSTPAPMSANGINTFDVRHSRYSANDNQFERSAPYRTSLQNVSALRENSGDFRLGFERNNQYRSTIQTAGINHQRNQQLAATMPQQRRYVYGGSVTPQPLRVSEFGSGHTKKIPSRGPSQSSLISSNPFDTDEDDTKEDISTTDAQKKTPRKKRRAPKPPITVQHKSNNDESTEARIESSQSFNSQAREERLHIDENNQIEEEQNNKIADLTAEIENYVKIKTFESPIQQRKQVNTVITTRKSKSPPPPPGALKPINIEEKLLIVDNNASAQRILDDDARTTPSNPVGNIECIHIHVESPHTKPPRRSEPSRVTSFQPSDSRTNSPEIIQANTSFTLANVPPKRVAEPLQLEKVSIEKISVKSNVVKPEESNNSDLTELKITEETPKSKSNNELVNKNVAKSPINFENENSNVRAQPIAEQRKLLPKPQTESAVVLESLPAVEAKLENTKIENCAINTPNNQPKLVLLKNSQQAEQQFDCRYRNSNLDWKKSTLAPLEENIPREKRKSVKDIIESINRSQRLLKAGANKDHTNAAAPNLLEFTSYEQRATAATNQLRQSTPEPNNNFSAQQNGRMFNEPEAAFKITSTEFNANAAKDTDDDALHKINNADIFKKCRVNKEVFDYRETSPTSSNLDWNPLPKPKRAKNLKDA